MLIKAENYKEKVRRRSYGSQPLSTGQVQRRLSLISYSVADTNILVTNHLAYVLSNLRRPSKIYMHGQTTSRKLQTHYKAICPNKILTLKRYLRVSRKGRSNLRWTRLGLHIENAFLMIKYIEVICVACNLNPTA
jgi:hypothetical protein